MSEFRKQDKTDEDLVIEEISEEELELIEKAERGEINEEAIEKILHEQEKTKEEVEAVVEQKEKKEEEANEGKEELKKGYVRIPWGEVKKKVKDKKTKKEVEIIEPKYKDFPLDTTTQLEYPLEVTEEVENELLKLINLEVLDAPTTKCISEKLFSQLIYFRGNKVEDLPQVDSPVKTLFVLRAAEIPVMYTELEKLDASEAVWEKIKTQVQDHEKYEKEYAEYEKEYEKKKVLAETMGKKLKKKKEKKDPPFPNLNHKWDARRQEFVIWEWWK